MTKRGRFEHRIRQPASCDLDGYDLAVVVACSGNFELSSPHEKITLADGDAANLTRVGDAPFRIARAASSDCYLVLLRACRNHAG